jgi:putative ABC transport system substrate-binding protein
MKRRNFMAGLGIVAVLPSIGRAQGKPRVGFLSSRSPAESRSVVDAFQRGLASTGFVDGRDVSIEYRWAEGRYDRLPALVGELVEAHVSVILAAGGPPSAFAAKKATTSIPIVFSAADDPVSLGLVESLSRPGGNVTGMSVFNAALSAKRLSLLHELVPTTNVIGFLTNPANPGNRLELREVQEAARARAVEVKIVNATSEPELATAFSELSSRRVGGVIVAGEPFFDSRRELIVALAAKHSIPASYSWRENVVLGGLFSYGTDLADSYRNAGVYCGRILKGERPADLPVMQPTRFELTINLKTAKSLGLNVPATLLTGADEVIE